jgi:hypothetical protein
MNITKPTKVYRKENGAEYILVPKPTYGDAYYMVANDCNALNGVMIYRTPEELDKMFSLTPPT